MTLVSDAPPAAPLRLVDHFERGLDAPICLTWELTYACNLSCVHCLSSSGRRDPRELTTEECRAVIDELERMQVFYVNIGGGEPTVRSDFWELVDYATAHHVGVKFSTNGVKITPEIAARLAANDYVDVQISLDGATAEVNDAIRGPRSYETAMRQIHTGQIPGLYTYSVEEGLRHEEAQRAMAEAQRMEAMGERALARDAALQEKEDCGEEDADELAKQRKKDDWKDTHTRGDGNRYNRN